jgi:membrane-bound lytic murein transglycosylase D
MATLANEHFPKPAELEPDVAFWVRVYSEIDTNSGYIHDAYNLAVVYETLELTGRRRADEKSISAAKARYAAILERLASDRNGLSTEQQRVLALWGTDVTATRLRDAATSLRFQRGQSDRFREGLARSGEWHDHIANVLAEKNLPAELAALPHVESSFNPDAYSSVGAAGIWQFTRSTGRRYLHIDYVVDERMDPFASTVAAAQLLQYNYQLTGTWPLALTAYNHGAAGVRRASKQLGSTDIAGIVRNYKGRSFGFASRNFYVSFLAAVEVSDNPERYFAPYKSAQPVQYSEVTLPDYLPIESFARAFDTDLAVLKRHNRALLDPVWKGKKRLPQGYTMRIPKDSVAGGPDELLAAIPPDQRFAEQTPDLFHKVVPGDTVSEIATRYGHSIRDVAAMNSLNKRYRIRIGQVLRLPLEGTVTTVAVPSTAPPPAQTTALELPEPAVAATSTAVDAVDAVQVIAGPPELMADPSDYTVASDGSIEVQATETLGHYAEWLDLRASQLRHINGIRYGSPVVIGHRLELDFSRVGQDEFERRRLAYQQDLQQAFFMTWQIRTTHTHVIAPGESLWVLTRRQFKVPMWLLRQYNPDLNLDRLHPGTVIVIPELVEA